MRIVRERTRAVIDTREYGAAMMKTKVYVIAGLASIGGYATALAVGVPWLAAATGPLVWPFVG